MYVYDVAHSHIQLYYKYCKLCIKKRDLREFANVDDIHSARINPPPPPRFFQVERVETHRTKVSL